MIIFLAKFSNEFDKFENWFYPINESSRRRKDGHARKILFSNLHIDFS